MKEQRVHEALGFQVKMSGLNLVLQDMKQFAIPVEIVENGVM